MCAKGIEPKKYSATPPQKISLKEVITEEIPRMISKISYFFAIMFSAYKPNSVDPKNFTSSSPSGAIQPDQIDLCKQIYAEAIERTEVLDKKAISMLTLISILVPLITSAFVYISTAGSQNGYGHKVIFFAAFMSLLFLLLSFVGIFRVLKVRNYEALYLQSIIDEENDKIFTFSADRYGRGLLWCATKNTAMNDHKADFLRASQLFIFTSVIFLIITAVPFIYSLSPDAKTQKITGEVTVKSATIETQLNKIADELKMVNEKLTKKEGQKRGRKGIVDSNSKR